MSKLQEFKDFQKGIEQKKIDLMNEISEIRAEVKELKANSRVERLNGSAAEADKMLTAAKEKEERLNALLEEQAAYEDETAMKIYRESKLGTLAEEVYSEEKANHDELKKEAAELEKKAAEMKDEYLNLLKQVGQLDKKAYTVSSRADQVRDFYKQKHAKLPETPSNHQKTGSPFRISTDESRRAYQQGRERLWM